MASKRPLVRVNHGGRDGSRRFKKAAIDATSEDDMVPFCKVVLKRRNDRDRNYFSAVEINRAFETHISPLFKMENVNFLSLIVAGPQRQALLNAINAASNGTATVLGTANEGGSNSSTNGTAGRNGRLSAATRARNIEMTTLAESNAGLPIRCHFDWTVSRATHDTVVLYGDPCTDFSTNHRINNEAQRAQDAELVRFFQSAPIALHWLSEEGNVLWANEAGLEVIGITAEEYIGQPIVDFCPDDKDLVLQVLQQLSQGHTVKDIPVRFRSRDGRTVDLLLDTHVQLDEVDGSIIHSRCFVRDDTKRQIREARAALLQEETKRSLQMLDNFMSRSLHHMRSPLHVLQTSMDIVKQHLGEIASRVVDQPDLETLVEDCDFLLVRARAHVTKAVDMIDDISDLARLDQGQPLRLTNDLIHLKDLGTEVFAHADVPSTVEVALELTGGGPPFIHSDQRYLKKILCNIVDHLSIHVANDVMRTITLKIGHTVDACLFSVTEVYPTRPQRSTSNLTCVASSSSIMEDYALGNSSAHAPGSGLPAIFQRYHQELLPHEESLVLDTDLDKASDRRDNILTGINSLRHNSMGMGLSLAYHLVRTLGGELRYASKPEKYTKFWFSLPHINAGVMSSERIVFDRPKIRYAGLYTKPSSEETVQYSKKPPPGTIVATTVAGPILESSITQAPAAPPVLSVVVESPSVLVVEDVPICAKLLCTILRQFKCSATWVKNGQEAVDLLTKDPDSHTLIFMDLRMPVMDGLTATNIIKNKLKLQTPVVALTGEGGDHIRAECMQIGFDAYCKKPMTREELMNVVKEHTGYAHQ